MRVRFLTDWFDGGVRVHAAGAIKDLDEATALRFLRRGVAEASEEAETRDPHPTLPLPKGEGGGQEGVLSEPIRGRRSVPPPYEGGGQEGVLSEPVRGVRGRRKPRSSPPSPESVMR